MKFSRYIFTAILLISLSVAKLKAQTVYITESGKKYHTKDCKAVKVGGKAITLAEAKKEGYEPCVSCKAHEIEEKEKEKPAKKTNGKG